MLRNRQLLLLMAILTAVAALGCAPTGHRHDSVIRLNLGAEPPSVDPALAEDPRSTQVVELLFLGLTDLDDETMEAVPELATRWEVSDDGLVWTFHLRTDVHWVHYDPATGRLSKKRPVTAADVEYAAKRALDPTTASPSAHVLFIIKNGEAYYSGRTANANEVGVRAVDEHVVEFTLERPAAYFPVIAGMWMLRPTPAEVIDEYGYKWTEPGNIWTNGPYVLQSWEHEAELTMVKNQGYCDVDAVAIERIHWSMISDEAEAFAQYKAGELDVCNVPAEDLAAVKADPVLSKELQAVPYLSTYYLGFNHSKPPFDNRLVRQAFSYALDRDTLIGSTLKGQQLAARSFAGPGVFGSPATDADFVEFDPERARSLLAQAGYPGGEGLPEITLTFCTGQLHRQVAEFAQRSWQHVLGVEVKLDEQEIEAYLEGLTQDPPQLFASVWTADYPDEHNWVFHNFHSGQGANRIRWHNTGFDRLVEEAQATSDAGRRRQLYAEAERLLCVDEAAIVPIFHPLRFVCTKPYVERTWSPLGNERIDRWTVRAR
jgi:oligopeptide transport system substrate-binding protein